MPQPVAPGAYGYTWHRIHLEIPDTDRPLAIAVAPIFAAYEIFASRRQNRLLWRRTWLRLRSAFCPHGQLPAAERTVALVIAIRSAEWKVSLGVPTGSSLIGTSWLGPQEAIELKLAASRTALLEGSNWRRVLCTGLGFGGLFFVMLGFSRKGDREFLWCGLLLLSAMMNRLYQIPEVLHIDSRMILSFLNFTSQSCFWFRGFCCSVRSSIGVLLSGCGSPPCAHWWAVSPNPRSAVRMDPSSFRPHSIAQHVPVHSSPPAHLLPPRLVSPATVPLRMFTHATLIIYVATNSIQNTIGFFDSGLNQLTSQGGGLQVSNTLIRTPILLMFFAMGPRIEQAQGRIRTRASPATAGTLGRSSSSNAASSGYRNRRGGRNLPPRPLKSAGISTRHSRLTIKPRLPLSVMSAERASRQPCSSR